jgi:hypothetical protein
VEYETFWWYSVAQLVQALRYNPEGGRFDFLWGHRGFLLNPSDRTIALMSTQSLTEIITVVVF